MCCRYYHETTSTKFLCLHNVLSRGAGVLPIAMRGGGRLAAVVWEERGAISAGERGIGLCVSLARSAGTLLSQAKGQATGPTHAGHAMLFISSATLPLRNANSDAVACLPRACCLRALSCAAAAVVSCALPCRGWLLRLSGAPSKSQSMALCTASGRRRRTWLGPTGGHLAGG